MAFSAASRNYDNPDWQFDQDQIPQATPEVINRDSLPVANHGNSFDLENFDNIQLRSNPNASRARHKPTLNRRLAAMALKLGLRVEEAHTSPTLDGTMDDMAKTTTPQTVRAVYTGDGGFSKELESARKRGLRSPLWGIPGGHMNDILSTLFTWWQRRRPETVLQHPDLQSRYLRPILVTVAFADGTEEERAAWGYAGDRLTARPAEQFNQQRAANRSRNRFRRFVHDARIVAKAIQNAEQYNVSSNGAAPQPAVAQLALNTRMAGMLRPGTDPFGKEFTFVQPETRWGAVIATTRLLLRRPVGEAIRDGHVLEFDTVATPESIIQIDGDEIQGAVIRRLRNADDGANVLTTR